MEDLQKVNKSLNMLWKAFKELYGAKLVTDAQCDEWCRITREAYRAADESPLMCDLVCAFTKALEEKIK